MIAERLAIPLHENPARQKFWRAVGFLGLILGAVLLGYLIDRAIHYRSSPQRWPVGANVEMRLIKTPRTTHFVREGFAGVQALPGAPWDLSEALSWSKREFVIYANDQEVLGLVVDGDIPAEVLASLPEWGWESLPIGQRTLIVRDNSPEPTAFERHFDLWLTLPVFDGSLTLKKPDDSTQGLPFRMSSATSLDFPANTLAFKPTTKLTLPPETQLLGSFALPANLAEAFLPNSVPATFPGLRNLSTQAAHHGLDVLLGQDDQGTAFVLAALSTNLSLEDLGEIATEEVSLQNLSTTALTNDDLPTSTEIRSSGEINVKVSNNDGLEVATAETVNGDLFRLTQSSTQLIVSNRSPIIGLESATYQGSCLRHPVGFLYPKLLKQSLPSLQPAAGNTLFEYLSQAEEIAYRKNWLRICW